MKAENKCEISTVKERFLPINESVAKGLEPEPKITDFQIVKELGAGSFGHVYLAYHKITKAQYAIKAINKRDKTNQEEKPYFRREIEVMYKIHHPNVVKLYGHFEDNKYCYFVMEYIPKGNIYGLIPTDKKKKLTQKTVASLIKDVISAVYYLHNMKPIIIHRDIKPENVLLAEGFIAKLTDFGWSNYMEKNEKRTTVCGTPIYLAPEIILEEGHNEKVDIWCIGVLCFELITGTVPFPGNDFETLKENILHLRIAWPKDINPEAKSLISKILKLDPNSRISLEEMLQQPFFTKYFPNASKNLIKPIDSSEYETFIISKDDPKTWDPLKNKKQISPKKIVKSQDNTNSKDEVIKNKYEALVTKYELLEKEYEKLKEENSKINEAEEIKKQIKEKEERIEELIIKVKENGEDPEESNLKNKCAQLEKENAEINAKIVEIEKVIKEKHGIEVENKLKEFKDSIIGKDKESYYKEIESVKNNLDKETRQKLNKVIEDKENEITKIKENERLRRQKDKNNFVRLINKYDKTLNWVEKENQKFKARIKELESMN